MSFREVFCWPIHYMADPVRQEPRNIGLIAHDRGDTHCVLVGDADRVLDTRYFCKMFGFSEEVGWVYSEWVRWFKGVAEDAHTVGAIQGDLIELARSGARFGAGNCFGTVVPAQDHVSAVAQRLFVELVTLPKLPKRSQFDTDLENVLFMSEIEFNKSLHRDVELEIQTPNRPVFVRLPIFIERPVKVGIKLLRFEGTPDSETATQADDILYSFDTLTAHGILDREHCVVLHDQPTARRLHNLDQMGKQARLLLLGDSATPRALWKLAQGF